MSSQECQCTFWKTHLSKMRLQSNEHKYVLELFQKIVCSMSVEYDELYEQLLQCWYRSVIGYYNSNWQPMQFYTNAWVHCYQVSQSTLGERTTNRLECINSYMKSVSSCYIDCLLFSTSFLFFCLV